MTDIERLAAIIVAYLEADVAARNSALLAARDALEDIRRGHRPASLEAREVVDALRAQVTDGNRLVREALDRQRGVDPTGTDPKPRDDRIEKINRDLEEGRITHEEHRKQVVNELGTDPSFHGGMSGFASTVRKPE